MYAQISSFRNTEVHRWYPMLAVCSVLFLEYQIATTNINGSQESVLPWFVFVATGLAALASVDFGLCHRRSLTLLSGVRLIGFPLAVHMAAGFIWNSYGGLSSGAF